MKHNNPFPPGGAWHDCFESFITSIGEKSGSKHTPLKYRAVLSLFFADGRDPARYVRSDVERFIRAPGQGHGREGQPVGAGCQNNRLSILKAFYKFASSWGILDSAGVPQPLFSQLSPCAGIQRIESEKVPYRSLTQNDVKAFFATIDDSSKGKRDRAIFLFLLLSGRRSEEVLATRWQDIKCGIIQDPATGVTHQGYLHSWYGKGHRRQQDSSELSSSVYLAILDYLQASGRLEVIKPEDYIFVSISHHTKEGEHLQRQSLLKICKDYARQAGLSTTICVHAWRHSNAMHRALAGQSLLEIAHALRWRNLQMCSVYLKELCNESDSGMARLEARFADL